MTGYYLKLFPDVQQKTASGFLTTLWNKDPFRTKWALIAKVYSFVRDEIGKDRVSLAYFLSLACPNMRIVDTSTYLGALGWSLQEDENGLPKLVQDETSATLGPSNSQSQDFPSTELELLSSLIRVGYFPDQGVDLMMRMGSNQNGIMATRGAKHTLQSHIRRRKLTSSTLFEQIPSKRLKKFLAIATTKKSSNFWESGLTMSKTSTLSRT